MRRKTIKEKQEKTGFKDLVRNFSTRDERLLTRGTFCFPKAIWDQIDEFVLELRANEGLKGHWNRSRAVELILMEKFNKSEKIMNTDFMKVENPDQKEDAEELVLMNQFNHEDIIEIMAILFEGEALDFKEASKIFIERTGWTPETAKLVLTDEDMRKKYGDLHEKITIESKNNSKELIIEETEYEKNPVNEFILNGLNKKDEITN